MRKIKHNTPAMSRSKESQTVVQHAVISVAMHEYTAHTWYAIMGKQYLECAVIHNDKLAAYVELTHVIAGCQCLQSSALKVMCILTVLRALYTDNIVVHVELNKTM